MLIVGDKADFFEIFSLKQEKQKEMCLYKLTSHTYQKHFLLDLKQT